MNKYTLYHKKFGSFEIFADYFDVEDRCFYFYERQPSPAPDIEKAVFPVKKTIISNITYNIKKN